MNFNTNQARHFYVALAKKDFEAPITEANVASMVAGDLALCTTVNDEFYFVYKNGDGIVTRSDTIEKANIEYVTKKTAANMAKKLLAYTVSLDTDNYALADLVGKTLTITVNVREVFDYDSANSIPVVASFKVTAAMSDAAAFHKALAIAIAKAMPKNREYPYFRIFSSGTEVTASTAEADVTGAAAGVVLVATPQKWVRGKLTGEPHQLSVSFNIEDESWGKVEVAESAINGYTEIPALYELADLEYFCYGERGDVYRGFNYPNNYEPTYLINPAGNVSYDVLTVQYFWQGHAENIQKSPRTIQIAGPAAAITAWEGVLKGE